MNAALVALLLVAQVDVRPSIDVGAGGAAISQVYISVCGVSLSASSGSSAGAVISGESRVCEMLRVAAALDAVGEHEQAKELVESAAELVDPKATLSQRGALWLRHWCLDPLFDLVPWIGSSAY